MRKFLFFMAAAIAAMSLSAAPVDQVTAFNKAKSYLSNSLYAGKMMAPAALNPVLLKAEMGDVKVGEPVYYIYNTSTNFIVVAGDDRATDILMVGDQPLKDINNLSPGMKDMLGQYKNEMMFLQQHPGLQVEKSIDNSVPMLKATTYGPLLTCNWDQTAPYWNQCTFTYSGTTYQCYTGCPATSASMVMYFWKYPTTATGTVAAYTSTLDLSSSRSVSFTYSALSSTTFDWNNMIDSYSGNYTTAQGTAVATLMRYVGQAEKMMYGTYSAGGSGISADNAQDIVDMYKFFGYDETTTRLVKLTNSYYSSTKNYTDAEWGGMIQTEILAGRPIVFMAISSSAGGHAFNVDGYRTDGYYHVNFGWSGDGNAWCALNSFKNGSYNFNQYQQMVIGIQPPTSEPRLTVDPTSLSFTSCYAGDTYTKTFTVKGYNLTGNVNLSVSGTGYTVSPSTLTATQANNGATVTVTYAPTAAGTHTGTVTVASSGAESKTVALSGTTAAKPVLTATPASLTFSASVGSTAKKTFIVRGTDLAGNVSLSVSGTGFSIDKTSVTMTAATSGSTITVTYAPTAAGTHTGTITISSTGADAITVPLNGTADDNTPIINVNPTSLAFSALTEQTQTKTFTVTGANLTGNLTLTLNNANGIYSINTTSITAAQAANGVTVTVTYAPTAAGNSSASVTISGGGATTQTVSLTGTATEPVRTITATPDALTFNNVVGETATQTFTVNGENLKGSNLTLTLNDENGVYSIEPSTITIAEATAGKTVTVTYAPEAFGNHNATITISGGSANPVTVTLAGQANLTKYAPVMLPANDIFVALTQFRADWTDATPKANVASYTLEVNAKVVEPVLIGTLDASVYTGGYGDVTLSAPWGGTNTRKGTGVVYFRNNYNGANSPGNITYTVPEGYTNATFTMRITTGSTSDGAGNLAVGTPQTASVNHTFTAGSTYYWLVTASSGEKITITTPDANYSPDMALIQVYSGDATASMLMDPVDPGTPDNYRLVTNIDPETMFYTVKDLTAGGTFLYRVKALYIDGTESEWSNIEEVTLHENEHPYQIGDVNHDGYVNVTDVTMLIAYVLGNDNGSCPACADINGDGLYNVTDVTALIQIALGGTSE